MRATINGSAGKTVFTDTELVFKLYRDKENKYSDTAPIRAFFYWFNEQSSWLKQAGKTKACMDKVTDDWTIGQVFVWLKFFSS